MMKMRAGMIAAVVVLGMVSQTAQAQPARTAEPTQEQLDAAKKHYDLGEAYKNLQKYREAEAEYLEAYRLSGKPFLKFNAGLVLWLAGDKEGATAHFRVYVAEDPAGDRVAEAQGYIDEVERAAREKAEAEQRAREAAERKRREAAEARAREAAEAARARAEAALKTRQDEQRAKEAEQRRRAAQERDAAPRPGAGLRVGGLVVAGGGVIAVAMGGVFGVKARSIADEMRDTMWSAEREARDAEGRAANRNMIIGYSIGAAAVVTGGVMYYLGMRAGREGVAVTPVAGEVTGLAVSGRF